MGSINLKNLVPHFIAVILFIGIALGYTYPVLQGKKVKQGDIMQHKGMAKEAIDHRAKYDEESLWTTAVFSGMPTYNISLETPNVWIKKFSKVARLYLPKPSGTIFLYMLCFYILLIVLGCTPMVAVLGSIAFAFSSYFFIILEAGHNTKALSIAYMPLFIAGVYSIFRKNLWVGVGLTLLGLGLQIASNHIQVIYYTMMLMMIFGGIEVYHAIKSKQIPDLLKKVGLVIIIFAIALGANTTRLWTTYVYAKETMRGGQTELTKENQAENTGGLDKDYAYRWSYGKSETFTLLVPNFKGGGSNGELGKKSATYQRLKEGKIPEKQIQGFIKNVPMYHGDQPFTSGPVYVGAIICFLFVLGLFIVTGPLKWWLFGGTLLSIVLAWGRHLESIQDLFFYYFPMYNKFRAPSTILIIAEFTIPLLAMLAIKTVIDKRKKGENILLEPLSEKVKVAPLYLATAITAGLAIFLALFGSAFSDFNAASDSRLGADWIVEALKEALKEDRLTLLKSSAWRSAILILLAAAAFFLYLKEKLNTNYLLLTLIVLVTFDMWNVNQAYFDTDNFVTSRNYEKNYRATKQDEQIKQDKDPHYRILNLASNTFNDAMTSYHHKSIGGYHPAKLIRYQDLIERQIGQRKMPTLNMLNMKYMIFPTKQGNQVQRNPDACGNAWFVPSIVEVANADEEMNAITEFNPKQKAFVDQRFGEYLQAKELGVDSTASIHLTSYKANALSYESNTSKEQFAVFSEVFYRGNEDWNAYIDGVFAPHVRTNYILRGMYIPKGKHTIEFKFEPQSYYMGEKISFIFSILLFGTVLFSFFLAYKQAKIAGKNE